LAGLQINAISLVAGTSSCKQLKALCGYADIEGGHTGHITARSGEAGGQTKFDRVGAHYENDGYRWGRCFGGQRRRRAVHCHDHSHPLLNQIGGHRR
jgi:hypothetical protein